MGEAGMGRVGMKTAILQDGDADDDDASANDDACMIVMMQFGR